MTLAGALGAQRLAEADEAAALMGVDHPLVRALNRLVTVSEQAVVLCR